MRMVAAIVTGLVATACGRRGFDARFDGSGTDATDSDGARAGGDGPSAGSCEILPSTCGPMGNRPCCESPAVAAGTFYRGYDVAAGTTYTDMSRPATVSAFRLDTYEVTVGRFRQFVAAGLGTQQNPPAAGAGARTLNGMTNQGGWDPAWNAMLSVDVTALRAAVKCNATYETWTDTAAGNENRPMVCITWYVAMAFCVWDGGFLPTEAESMYAASGGSLQRAYPWSSPAGSVTIDCTLTNYGGPSWPTTACAAAGATNVDSTSPAGDGVWGQANLGGNVAEWALDWYASPLPAPCTDCANLITASNRALRGGSFDYDGLFLRAASRGNIAPTYRGGSVGARCGRTP